VASLSYTPVGAQRLGAAGVIDGLSASMSAFLESSVDLQIYGCFPPALPVRHKSEAAVVEESTSIQDPLLLPLPPLPSVKADSCAICASCAAFERLARNPVNRALIQASILGRALPSLASVESHVNMSPHIALHHSEERSLTKLSSSSL